MRNMEYGPQSGFFVRENSQIQRFCELEFEEIIGGSSTPKRLLEGLWGFVCWLKTKSMGLKAFC